MFSETLYYDAVHLSQVEGYLTGRTLPLDSNSRAHYKLASALAFILCDVISTLDDEVSRISFAKRLSSRIPHPHHFLRERSSLFGGVYCASCGQREHNLTFADRSGHGARLCISFPGTSDPPSSCGSLHSRPRSATDRFSAKGDGILYASHLLSRT